ncbi:hypothetical protein EVAR_64784_1 [Eumeta japonica]|uniref:Uncharacterized protein n=1 Tax=Eumeta variegata TaxID=151549 RepID=A0A4C1ZMU9_EUMVA|nr:hypothetical protein EVAR_64784_1 [Eumeta japonica]
MSQPRTSQRQEKSAYAASKLTLAPSAPIGGRTQLLPHIPTEVISGTARECAYSRKDPKIVTTDYERECERTATGAPYRYYSVLIVGVYEYLHICIYHPQYANQMESEIEC